MAPAPTHVRVVWSGTLGTAAVPPEIWSFGLSYALGSLVGANDATTKTVLDALAVSAKAEWAQHIGPKVQSTVKHTKTRVSQIGANGKELRYLSGAFMHSDQLGGTNGTSAVANGAIFQTALVVSLRTAVPGRTGRGRFFLPMPGLNAEPLDGRITAAKAIEYKDAMLLFVQEMEAAAIAAGTGATVVASGGSVVEGRPPSLIDVTSVQVGRVLDVMRTRRNALLEEYSVGALA